MPSVVLGLAVIRTDKFLPDEPSFEAAGPAFFNFMDDILEIPSRPGVSRNFEFEEAETDFIFGAVHPIEHQDEAHSMSGAPVVEGLSESGTGYLFPVTDLRIAITNVTGNRYWTAPLD